MGRRWGLGPVFAWEWAAGTRRWQTYAARSLFVAALLAGLVAVRWSRGADVNFSTRAQAGVGQSFFFAIVGIQIVLVMLAAPAATAGSICIDRARGTLAHMLVTDLSAAEIVLGKLAARLVPVLTLVACTLPVLLLGTLLGGVDPTALAGAFAVLLGLAILGCSLAMTLSIWVAKVHEALMATYLALIALPLAYPAWRSLDPGTAPDWLHQLDPFWLAFAPYVSPGSVGLGGQLAYLAGALAASAALILLAVARLRGTGTRRSGPPVRRRRRVRLPALPARWVGRLPGPSLDGNPVLWREWHRRRPSRWSFGIWAVYSGMTLLFSVVAIWSYATGGGGNWSHGFAAWVNGLQLSAAFLLLSVSAATTLAEERQRGSLDVLLVTPLPTRAIVLGKWLGTFRTVPILTILPVAVAAAICTARRSWWLVLIAAFTLALGAAITSLGLAVATWVPRFGRALALTVSAYVLVAVGWLFLVIAVSQGWPNQFEGLMGATPFYGIGNLTYLIHGDNAPNLPSFVAWMVFWTIAYATAAGLLLMATLRTFDRCLGRVGARSGEDPDAARRRKRKPKPAPNPAAGDFAGIIEGRISG